MDKPPTSGTVSVKSGVPVPLGLLYRLNVVVPVGLKPPVTVAWSRIVPPTGVVAGCCVVLINTGGGRVTVTGSDAVPLETALLLLSPLYVATQ